MEHRSDVTCLSFKSNPDMIASADISDNPDIFVWSPSSLSILKHIKAHGLKGLAKIVFSPDSQYLLTLSTDRFNTLSIFGLNSGV